MRRPFWTISRTVIQPAFYLFAFSIFVSPLIAQATRDSDHKSDRNLRSSARVNPATLAMEFSLPLGGYVGRAGHSMPVSFEYSSKLWTMRQTDFRGRFLAGEGTQARPFEYTYITSLTPLYAERSMAGWTSSLMPISIIPEVESYTWDGVIAGGSPQRFAESSSHGSCIVLEDYWEYDDPACPFGKHIVIRFCSGEEQLTGTVTTITCHGGPEPNPTPPGPGPEPGPNPEFPFPVPDYRVKRLRVQMPNGSTQEFRKDDNVYDCNLVPCTADEGTYLSIDGSALRLLVGTEANSTGMATLFLPDGGRYIFSTVPDGSDQQFTDKNGNIATFDFDTRTWTDTMGRTLTDPLPYQLLQQNYGVNAFSLPGLGNQTVDFAKVGRAKAGNLHIRKRTVMLRRSIGESCR